MIPLSLYIHIPWCIQKCPYCDFNSHQKKGDLPEIAYVERLLSDLKQDIERFNIKRPLHSIFIGGGTPSLFSAHAYELLFKGIQALLPFNDSIEITMEANPGTVEQQRFKAYRELGINRLSLGIQSFNPIHLKKLGRIHDDKEALLAIDASVKAGFDNFNLDIMHGLPNQTLDEGLNDLKTAISLSPTHLSWYQLTLEPNTVFYKTRPTLPHDETLEQLENEGLALLKQHGFERYEISAFAKTPKQAKHNLNYWTFGDYLGIGAGAHGKVTDTKTYQITRTQKHRLPKDYLNPDKTAFIQTPPLTVSDIIFEFMLNTTRLEAAIPFSLFTTQTGLTFDLLKPGLLQAQNKGLILMAENSWQITPFGRRFTNDLQTLFID